MDQFFSPEHLLADICIAITFPDHLFSKQRIPNFAYFTVLDCDACPWPCFLPLLPLMLSGTKPLLGLTNVSSSLKRRNISDLFCFQSAEEFHSQLCN